MEEAIPVPISELPAEPARRVWDTKSGLAVLAIFAVLIVIAVMIQAFALIAANGIDPLTNPTPDMTELTIPPSLIAITAITQGIAMAGSVLLVGKLFLKRSWAELGFRPAAPIWMLIAVGLAIPLAVMRGFLVQRLLLLAPSLGEGLEELAKLFSGGQDAVTIAVSVLMVSFLIPLYEEIFFRGFLYRWMRNGMGVIAAALLSSILFGVFHLNVPQGVSVFFLGLALAWLYEQSDSLLPAIALHVTTNLFGQALLYLLLLLNIPIQ